MASATATTWQPLSAAEMAELFPQLAADWRERSKYMSNTMQMAALRPYQRIIGMGPAVLPVIFAELERNGGFWHMALEAITGEDPVPAEDRGFIPKMRAAWLSWGEQHGLIG